MQIDLSQKSIDKIAEKVARIIIEAKFETWVSTEEAAEILGISPNYLRRIKDRYVYAKSDGKQAHLRFKLSSLKKTRK